MALKGCWDLNWKPLCGTKLPCHLCEPASPFKVSERRENLGRLTHSCQWHAAMSIGALANWARRRRERGDQQWFGTGCSPECTGCRGTGCTPAGNTPTQPCIALHPESPQAYIPASQSAFSIPSLSVRAPTLGLGCCLRWPEQEVPTARATHLGCILGSTGFYSDWPLANESAWPEGWLGTHLGLGSGKIITLTPQEHCPGRQVSVLGSDM